MTDLDGARDGDRVEALGLGRSLATAQAAIWIFQELEICALFFFNEKMDITHLCSDINLDLWVPNPNLLFG